MIEIIYCLYFFFPKETFFSNKDFLGRFLAFLIRKTTPIYYRTTIPFQNEGITKNFNNNHIIVSITSYPGRINQAWMSIESLLRQTVKPNKIILWLGKEKFSTTEELSEILKKQMKRGLSVEFREDLKPHTKYYYAMNEYPTSTIITVDDDIFYPSNLIEELMKFHRKFPESIICNGARQIRIDNNAFLNYSNWPNWHDIKIDTTEKFDILPLGVMGVLYPPNKLHDLLFNKELLIKNSLNADDLWLKTMSIKKGTKSLITNSFNRPFVDIANSQIESLYSSNIGENQNDKQIKALNNEFGLFKLYSKLLGGFDK